MKRARVVVIWLLVGAAPVLGAQQRGAAGGAGRQQLEQRVRERFADIVRQRVGLTDDQMQKLRQTNETFEARRRTLVEQERDVRIGLRSEVLAGEKADQQRISQLLDEMVRVQRERIGLLEQEQRALAGFMSPIQRARYLGVQDQIRRTMEDMRRRRQTGREAPRGPARAAPPD